MKISDVRVGDRLIADGGFDCMMEGREVTICRDPDGLYVWCNEGRHYLDGQVSDDGELIGFKRKKS